jgi:hypothetical protein
MGKNMMEFSGESTFSDGAQIAVAHAGAGEALTALAARFGFTEEQAANFVAELEEVAKGLFGGQNGDGAKVRMIRRGIRHVICAKTYRQQAFLLRCLMIEIGWLEELDGIGNPTDLARKFGLTKADANKFCCLYRDGLTDDATPIPNRPNQRPPRVRAKFAGIRRQQEKKRRKHGRL